MSYRSLLLYLETEGQNLRRTQLALALARGFDAHLIGLAPAGLVELPAALGAEIALGSLTTLAWQSLRRRAEDCAQAFREACIVAQAVSYEALVEEADAATALVRHAHGADLCIVGQADASQPGHALAQERVEQLVLFGARPTLVVPSIGGMATLGEQVLLAWDDSREAARAVADALPLLCRAKQVHAVCFASAAASGDAVLRAGTERLRRWLHRHGVACELHLENTDIGVGEALLSRAADLDIDLIVMGAYGHTRLSERILGGATRVLLQSMTVPVLMSH
jgi:nucleotide-binding universal stress UspA family protein